VTQSFWRVCAVLVGIAATGAAGLVLAWRGSAATLDVWYQMPFLASGAVGGAALIGTGIALLTVHLDRQNAADEQAVLEEIVHAAALRRSAPVAVTTDKPVNAARTPRRRAPANRVGPAKRGRTPRLGSS
jgi:hypothetical protein